jgi:signal transduction histidine kinase
MKDESLESMKQSAGVEQRGVQLRGNWLLFARLSWVIVALFSLSYFLFSFDATFSATFAFSRGVFAPQGFGNTLLTVDRSMLWILCPVLWCAIGALVFWQSSRKRKSSGDFMVLFVSLTLVATGLSLPFLLQIGGIASPPTHLERVVRIVVAALGNDCLLLLLFLFPDGRFAPRWMSVPIVALLLLAFCVNFFDVPLLSSWFIGFGSPLSLLMTVLGLTSLLYKYRRVSSSRQRQQTRWAVLGLLVFWGTNLATQLMYRAFGMTLFTTLLQLTLYAVTLLFLQLAFSVALLRDRLWEITPLIRRTLVYGLMTAGLFVAYIVIVAGLGSLFPEQDNTLIAILTISVIAFLFRPLRVRLQRAINRLLYGERDDPYAVIARLGQRIEAVVVPRDVLPGIVETVAQALKLPYVAIALKDGQTFSTAAAYGRQDEQSPLIQVPLLSQHEQIGVLVCHPRQGDDALTEPDTRLLQDLTIQIGAAIHAIQLTIDLQRSRERLVSAREEERRRLRRDLHDGLGPTLASLSQRIDTASHLVAQQPEEAIALLQTLKGQVRTTIADIRRLVYALRPPVLDEFGLISAIREHAIPAQQSSDVRIAFTAPEHLPPLSAAIEVAAFRIIEEALTNVVRHARAHQCQISMELAERGDLLITITDDGKGLPEHYQAGVGIRSMRERAEELEGTFTIQTRPTGGTQVHVCLPLMKEKIVWNQSVS